MKDFSQYAGGIVNRDTKRLQKDFVVKNRIFDGPMSPAVSLHLYVSLESQYK